MRVALHDSKRGGDASAGSSGASGDAGGGGEDDVEFTPRDLNGRFLQGTGGGGGGEKGSGGFGGAAALPSLGMRLGGGGLVLGGKGQGSRALRQGAVGGQLLPLSPPRK